MHLSSNRSAPSLRTSRLRVFSVLAVVALGGCHSLSDAERTELDLYKQRSKQYYNAGYYDRAADQCRRGLLVEPDDQSLLQVLGMSLLLQNDPRATYDQRLQEAATYFEQAIDSEDEFDYRNRTGLGEVLTRLVAIRLAMVESVNSSTTLSPADKAQQLGKLRENIDKNGKRAAEVLHEVLDQPKTKDNDFALSTLARLKSQTHEYAVADELLSRLDGVLTRSIHLRSKQLEIENWPAEVRLSVHSDIDHLKQVRVDALKLHTSVLKKLGRDDDVIQAYGQIEAEIAMQPADYFNRASTHERLGHVDEAIADYDKFISLAAASGVGLTDTVRSAMDKKAELIMKKHAAAKP
jgi:tetratricopeptide (TPR) repeat protein